MADEFWKNVYDKLKDNYELLKLICLDTANQDLLSWVNPNHELKVRCNRYLKYGVIANKNGLIEEIINYSKTNIPLRKIILMTWVDKNPNSMSFFNQAGNAASIEKLKNGEFGNISKVRILSYIDPRQGSYKLYKDILEEADKKEQEKAKSEKTKEPNYDEVSISNAEIEAVLHSKEIIASPDTNKGAYSGNFNEIVYEELQKIKAALEVLKDVNKQLKTENKDLRNEQTKNKTEITSYSTKLENKVNENKKLSSELAKEKDLNSSLSTQLKFAKEELAIKPTPSISESEINELRYRLDEALKENDWLKKSLSNKEASLTRIKNENEELNLKVKDVTDQKNIITSLQKKLANVKSKDEKKNQIVVGQIITKTKFPKNFGEKAGKKCWLFVSIIGQVYYFDLNDVPKNLSVPEEFLLATLENNKLVSMNSLETDKKELLGIIKKENGNSYLDCQDCEQQPIYLDITEKWIGRPARGIWLPELDNRNSGIYKLDILPDTAKLNKKESKVVKKSLEKTNKEEETIKYNGQKIIVFGGDRVGLEYEKALNQIGLDAKWFSGFSLLSEISLRFGKPDLMVIITKQISHALLRELNSYSDKNSISVVYSVKRGVSSVIELVKNQLSKP